MVVLDLRARVIPDVVTLPALGYALLRAAALQGAPSPAQALIGAAVAGGAVLLLAVMSRGGVGGGDIKLAAVLGAALGWQGAIMAVALSQLLGALIALGLLAALRRRPARHLPVGALIALLGALLLVGAP